MRTTKLLLFLVLLYPAVALNPVVASGRATALVDARTETFIRTELFFGLTKPDKTTLTDGEWSSFVDDVITPRFPDGFTVLDGKGQWRNKEGKIVKEYSKVFIVVYLRRERVAAGKKIEEIREEYKRRFDQESVLRVDMKKSVLVNF